MTVNYMTCRHCIASNESNPALNARVDERNLAFYESHSDSLPVPQTHDTSSKSWCHDI
jgi:hypothetical protein